MKISTYATLAMSMFTSSAIAGVQLIERDTAVSCSENVCQQAGCELYIADVFGCTGATDSWACGCGQDCTDTKRKLCGSAQVEIKLAKNPKGVHFTNAAGDTYDCTFKDGVYANAVCT
jgi:hypothetical protein